MSLNEAGSSGDLLPKELMKCPRDQGAHLACAFPASHVRKIPCTLSNGISLTPATGTRLTKKMLRGKVSDMFVGSLPRPLTHLNAEGELMPSYHGAKVLSRGQAVTVFP